MGGADANAADATTPRSADEWGQLYAARRSSYEDFRRRVEALVNDLLRSEGIDVIQVESRTKTVTSFTEKINRKGPQVVDPFGDLTDLVGVRIITYYGDDVTTVSTLLDREFTVLDEHSGDRSKELASDQFGYRSTHLVAELSEARSKLVEWGAYAGLRVEFQVRTALQHAWAAVSHKVDYKTPQEAPEHVRRRLYRLSALFELADEQFSTLRDVSAETAATYRANVGEGHLDVPVDSSSLRAYWGLTERLTKLVELLDDEGLTVDPDEDVGATRLRRDHSDLVTVLKQCGITTLSALDEYLRDEENMRALARALVECSDPEQSGSAEDLLTQLVIIDRDDSDEPGFPIYDDDTVADFRRARELLAGPAGSPPPR